MSLIRLLKTRNRPVSECWFLASNCDFQEDPLPVLSIAVLQPNHNSDNGLKHLGSQLPGPIEGEDLSGVVSLVEISLRAVAVLFLGNP